MKLTVAVTVSVADLSLVTVTASLKLTFQCACLQRSTHWCDGLGRAAGMGELWLSVDKVAWGLCPCHTLLVFLPTLPSACSVWFPHLFSLQSLERLKWMWIPEVRMLISGRTDFYPLSYLLSSCVPLSSPKTRPHSCESYAFSMHQPFSSVLSKENQKFWARAGLAPLTFPRHSLPLQSAWRGGSRSLTNW